MSVTVTEGWKFYIEQWVIPQKCDLQRTRAIAKWWITFLGPRAVIEAVTIEQLDAAMDAMVIDGKASGTRRKRLTIYYAMCSFNVKKKRVHEFAKIALPPASPPVQRSFEEAEVARLFAEPMPYRIGLFFLIDFETAARSKAIEQLTVGRCDWQRRVVDYRLPGVNHKNKRRGEVAISDVLFDVLWQAATKHGPPWKDDLIIPPGEYRVGKGLRSKAYDPSAPVRSSTTTYPGCLEDPHALRPERALGRAAHRAEDLGDARGRARPHALANRRRDARPNRHRRKKLHLHPRRPDACADESRVADGAPARRGVVRL